MRLIGVVMISVLVPVTATAQPSGPPTCSRCGPAPSYPSWFCADRRHQGGRGPCVERQDGSCGFVHLVCPEDRPRDGARGACGAAECGPPPAASSWSCPGGNGTGAFGACKRDRDGRCGWVHEPCRAQSQRGGHVQPAAAPPPGAETPTHSCAHLPGADQLRAWPVVAVCRPGGGPAPAPITRIRSLGDGTFVFSGRAGCFRARYVRCLSK